jgi:hypothetical protein
LETSRPEYDFESNLERLKQQLFSKKSGMIFQYLLLSCFGKKQKKLFLKMKKQHNVNQLIIKIRNFQHQTNLPLTLNNFITLNHISTKLFTKKV